jgi:hypothetical protein
MTVPNIDTFENDITSEIKSKEATIGDIASASGDVGNIPQPQNISPFLLIIASVFIIIITTGIIYFGYVYYNKKMNPPVNTAPIQIPEENDTTLLPEISPSFTDAIGRFVTNVEKKPNGYVLTLIDDFSSFSSVYSYMIKNASYYAKDIASAVDSFVNTGTTTPPFIFSDVTINNQNMRVGESASSTVVYAFINNRSLIISSSTAGILFLRSEIVR